MMRELEAPEPPALPVVDLKWHLSMSDLDCGKVVKSVHSSVDERKQDDRLKMSCVGAHVLLIVHHRN